MRIDAHHHLWRYSAEAYPWITDELAALRQDYLPEHLLPLLRAAGVHAGVVVQATRTLDETRWLLDLAHTMPHPCAVVGWVPLCSETLGSVLDSFADEQKLAGMREILQDALPGALDSPELNQGIGLLGERGYSFDLLVRAHQIAEATRLVDRVPGVQFVLDHAGKPPIAQGGFEPWNACIGELAQRHNVVCKLSGLVTEADWNGWSASSLAPYLDACVQAFGTERLLAGSDWPVCLAASTYQGWWSVLEDYFRAFSEAEQENVFGLNAARVYRLEQPDADRDATARGTHRESAHVPGAGTQSERP